MNNTSRKKSMMMTTWTSML
jgi:hypothetical protein